MGEVTVTGQVLGHSTLLAAEMGLELVDVTYKREGGDWVLRVLLDREGGITLDDCQEFSRALEGLMDAEDMVHNPYLLEVSSAGLDRPLKSDKDFTRFSGRLVAINTFAPLEGRKKFTGQLKGLEGDAVVVLVDEGKAVPIPREMIAKAHLEIDDALLMKRETEHETA